MKTRQCALLATFIAIIWAFGIVNLKADPFQVQTFKAWEAYNTSNGLWRVADFSGDGKTDLINLNQAGNTTYLWTSKGKWKFYHHFLPGLERLQLRWRLENGRF